MKKGWHLDGGYTWRRLYAPDVGGAVVPRDTADGERWIGSIELGAISGCDPIAHITFVTAGTRTAARAADQCDTPLEWLGVRIPRQLTSRGEA